MFTRGLAICLILAVASVAQAGAVLTLERTGTGDIPVGSSETINLYVTQTGGVTTPPMLVRMIQLDMSASGAGLSFAAPGTSGTIVEMWDYASAGGEDAGCWTDDPSTCGDAHLIDADFTDSIVSTAFGDASHLDPDGMLQMNLGDGVQVKIGEISVTCMADGSQTMDVLNASDTDLDAGAKVMFGFGVNIDDTPITVWDAYGGNVTGNSLQLPCSGVGEVNLVDSSFPCDMSLTRTEGHVLRLVFDGDISAPAAGQLVIQELAAGGAFTGPDLSDQFTYTVEGGTTLRIAETGTVLATETWYGIYNAGTWPGVGNFEMDYVVVRGDVNNSGFTNFSDLSTINQNLTGTSADDDVYDINASGFVNFSDISTANQSINSEAPAKPDGHVCTLP